ncbi:MAG: hypothetical protein A2Z71_05930 [Chloroflexi bacterium RBG_13_50_21]|nr:MAG: hypothetical protein A2Z71_05930 [Chloroflexi bacterium RBG_13_50_21]OGO59855.1 MAG: hypothetical protein A2029_00525 [Chloroflexi bacterium RBG_19FT_COMBO_47_9]
MIETIRKTITEFCQDFIDYPYLCYTEHGQHALFYTMLYNGIPEEQRYITYINQKVCILQKEYPTAGKLGKPQRQHWDIAVLESTQESIHVETGSYDYFNLVAAIEFGMNEAREHLQDDIERLCHVEANIEHGFIVHLYRLSESGKRFSNRDWSSKSPRIMTIENVRELSIGKSVEIFLGLADITGIHASGVWNIKDGQVLSLK